MEDKNPKEKMNCHCQCWKCAVHNHVGCESHTSVCNVEWVKIKNKLRNK